MIREERKENNDIREKKSSFNVFSPIQDEIGCTIFNNFGHNEIEYRIRI